MKNNNHPTREKSVKVGRRFIGNSLYPGHILGLFLVLSLTTLWAGDVKVGQNARFSGSFGLQIDIVDSTTAYVQDDSPVAESRYRARFYVCLDGANMGTSDSLYFFGGYRQDDQFAFRLMVRESGGDKLLRLEAMPDSGIPIVTPVGQEVAVTEGYHFMEVDWSASNGDGHCRVWLDGDQVFTFDNLSNSLGLIDHAALGAITEMTNTTSGFIYFDDFISQNDAYIGPLPCRSIYEYEQALNNWPQTATVLDMTAILSNACFF